MAQAGRFRVTRQACAGKKKSKPRIIAAFVALAPCPEGSGINYRADTDGGTSGVVAIRGLRLPERLQQLTIRVRQYRLIQQFRAP